MMPEITRCFLCGEVLNDKRIVWLELSNTNGKYYRVGETERNIPVGHKSQGIFPFGSTCAMKQLKDSEMKRN